MVTVPLEIAGGTVYHRWVVARDLPLPMLIGAELLWVHKCGLQYGEVPQLHFTPGICEICAELRRDVLGPEAAPLAAVTVKGPPVVLNLRCDQKGNLIAEGRGCCSTSNQDEWVRTEPVAWLRATTSSDVADLLIFEVYQPGRSGLGVF